MVTDFTITATDRQQFFDGFLAAIEREHGEPARTLAAEMMKQINENAGAPVELTADAMIDVLGWAPANAKERARMRREAWALADLITRLTVNGEAMLCSREVPTK